MYKTTITDNYILITSDEEIKQGDWVIDKHNSIYLQETDKIFQEMFTHPKKIIYHLPLNNAPKLEGITLLPPLPSGEDYVNEGKHLEMGRNPKETFIEYYNETYGSKGGDDHVPDVRKMVSQNELIKICQEVINKEPDDATERERGYTIAFEHMLGILQDERNITSSQTEISDEEIEKAANKIIYFLHPEIMKNVLIKYPSLFKDFFIQGATWYREQLKKK